MRRTESTVSLGGSSYVLIPDDVLDILSTVRGNENPPTTRLILRKLAISISTHLLILYHSAGVDSPPFGTLAGARARAHFETVVMAENESLIRSFHQSLEVIEQVYLREEPGAAPMWLVPVTDELRLLDTHAGGLEIHHMPVYERAPPHPGPPALWDPNPSRINGRRMLTPADVRTLRTIFPSSVGVRVLIAGSAVVELAEPGVGRGEAATDDRTAVKPARREDGSATRLADDVGERGQWA